jgi:uncharacterized membrane protein required for colicin V production
MRRDTILILVLIGFLLVGARRGALTAGTSVVSLLIAYAGGIYCAQRLSGAVAVRLGVSEIYASVAAATLGFMAALVIAGLLGSLLRGWDRARLGMTLAVGSPGRW